MWNIRKIVKKGDYAYAVVPEHPRATKHGYVLVHRIVVENHLNRLLNANEVVHHKNGQMHDNRLENLEVLTNSKHAKHHAHSKGQMRIVFRCPSCGCLFERPKGSIQGTKRKISVSCSIKCRGRFSRKLQLEGRTQEVEAAISGNLVREYRYFPDNSEETA